MKLPPTPEAMAEHLAELLRGDTIAWSSAANCSNTVKSAFLKPIALTFSTNLKRCHAVLRMPHTVMKLLATMLSTAVQAGKTLGKDRTWELLQTLGNSSAFEERILSSLGITSAQDYYDGVSQKVELIAEVVLSAIMAGSPEAAAWEETQLYSAVVSAWTAFECLAADSWAAALNHYPMQLYDKACGFARKNVRITFLAKYKFDLRNRLGTLLRPRFDLNSLAGIRKAYRAVFDREKVDEIFQEPDLSVLEATRHLIVHRAGLVDERFQRRTKRSDFHAKLGSMLVLEEKQIARLLNAAVFAGGDLLAFIDELAEKYHAGADDYVI